MAGDDLRARGIRFVQDALREVPGAMVVQSGSFGGVSSVFLRGGESDYVKVLIDGVPANQSGGAFNWANLTTENIDRIEILRGPGSVIYGSDAVSGVVQIFTRRGQGGFSVEGGAEGGTFGTVNGRGGGAWGNASSQLLGGGGPVRYRRYLPVQQRVWQYGPQRLGTGAPDAGPTLRCRCRYSDSRYHFPTDFAGALADSNQSSAEKSSP